MTRTTDAFPAATRVPVLRLLAAAAFSVLLVLAGTEAWWMVPLAAVAAPLGFTPGGGRLGVVAMAVAVAAGAVAVLAGWADLRDVLVGTARGVLTGALPWAVAVAWRARRTAEAEAALALVREQDAERLRAETGLARQRLHLAETLHDDLGHALSLVAVNLGRLELELERGGEVAAGRDGRVLESVALARRQVSDAVARLGASVQALRAGRGANLRHEDGPTGVDALVLEARRSGADVVLTGSPGAAALEPFGPAVVRVVQEGLTNALRHAPGAPVRVELVATGQDRLVVSIRNPLPTTPALPASGAPADGAGPSTAPTVPTGSGGRLTSAGAPTTGGTGLRSLTEHVRTAGGTVTAGPDGDDYVLRVELRAGQVDEVAPPADPVPDAGALRDARSVTHGLALARRRGGVLLLAAVLVPTAALAAVAVAIQVADTFDARRALLGPAAFTRIGPGDPRSEVEPLLPATTLDAPPGADPACDYYAVTADPLADASGDAYRICWAGDRVASTDLVVGAAR